MRWPSGSTRGVSSAEATNAADGKEEHTRDHTADIDRLIEADRRRRRWWPAVAAGSAAAAALLLGLLVEQQCQVIPLRDPSGGWRGHISEQDGCQIVDFAVEASRERGGPERGGDRCC